MMTIAPGQPWTVTRDKQHEECFGEAHDHAICGTVVTVPVRRRLGSRADGKGVVSETVDYEVHRLYIDIDLTWLTGILGRSAAKTMSRRARLACGAITARLDRAPYVPPSRDGCALGVLADRVPDTDGDDPE